MMGVYVLMVKVVAYLLQDEADVVHSQMLCAVVTVSTAVLMVTHVTSLPANVSSRLIANT